MQATSAVEEIVEGGTDASPEERETAARVTALMRHLFLWDRGNQLRVMEETGLSLTQCKAILEIGGLGEVMPSCQLKELAERLGASTPAISRAVDDLVKKQLVTRVEDPDDRRARRIELTAKGREVVDRIVTVRLKGITAFATSLTAAQRRKLDVAVDALMDREDIAETYQQLKGSEPA
ncbi:MAG: MarR family transcriptional regulator [Actinobacteria bacterium]|nr:MarR family transcriptional regulator [Actinomycetota bacterium]